MRILAILLVCLFSASAVANEKSYTKGETKSYTKGEIHYSDRQIYGVRTTLYAIDSIFDLSPDDKTKFVVTNTYQTKDDHDTTIGCYGIPSICDMLDDIIDIVMDDGDAWGCVSVPGGVECTHRPH